MSSNVPNNTDLGGAPEIARNLYSLRLPVLRWISFSAFPPTGFALSMPPRRLRLYWGDFGSSGTKQTAMADISGLPTDTVGKLFDTLLDFATKNS